MAEPELKPASRHLYWSRAPTRLEGTVAPKRLANAASSSASVAAAAADAAPWCPLYKWGQRGATVYLTIFVPCLKGDDDVKLDITATDVTFRAQRIAEFAGGQRVPRNYRLFLRLRDDVDPSRSVYHLRHDHVRIELIKRCVRPWRSLQAEGVPKNANERPDFDHCDSDSDDEPPAYKAPAASRKPAAPAWRLPSASALLRPLRLEAREACFVLLVCAYAAACPFSKVEESFNLQAVHDLLFHQAELGRYDHHDFPGVVPRTFVGAVALAAASAPLVLSLSALGMPKLHAQLLVRLVLGLASAAASLGVLRATRRRLGRPTASALLLLTCVQFHPLFYASRTLPNTFGTLAAALATAAWLDQRHQRAIGLLTAATVVFRADLLLLLAPLALLAAARRRLPLRSVAATGLATGAAALLLSAPLDSLLWRRAVWPEAEVLLANTLGHMSAGYGASPWHWYFSSALPRMLSVGYPLALASLWLAPAARELVLVALAFVTLYSLLPHKELRFVLCAAPMLNVGAAAALAGLHARIPAAPRTAGRKLAAFVARAALAAGLAAAVALCCCFLAAARLNYPGAHAMLKLHALTAAEARPPPRVHIGVEAAVSGASRFLELGPPWRYSKREGLAPHELRRYSHLLAAAGEGGSSVEGFELLHEEEGFVRVSLVPPFLVTEPKIQILKRKPEAVASRSRDRAEGTGGGGDFFH